MVDSITQVVQDQGIIHGDGDVHQRDGQMGSFQRLFTWLKAGAVVVVALVLFLTKEQLTLVALVHTERVKIGQVSIETHTVFRFHLDTSASAQRRRRKSTSVHKPNPMPWSAPTFDSSKVLAMPVEYSACLYVDSFQSARSSEHVTRRGIRSS